MIPTNSEWLAQNLSSLLSSPYIHFPKPPAGLPGLRLGHGPIDLFSTRFTNLFSDEAKGTVDGQEVDKAGLKDALLAIQRTWNADSANVTPSASADPKHIAAELTWTLSKTDTRVEAKATATTIEEGGAPRINFLKLEGDKALFQSQSE
ncbi:hypothetical protein NLI96_g7423 [Meripilus lineatus]|uniref:Uncharacterized protein n=1 Tax=Meripilus lineatus TaxID=2056292 RepID=A0AAD5V0Z8_9APHY|nr:hypothetical protein NLI96_g7423 [Physisporinus lineatus]